MASKRSRKSPSSSNTALSAEGGGKEKKAASGDKTARSITPTNLEPRRKSTVPYQKDVEKETLAYKVLDKENTRILTELETIEDVQEKLAEILSIKDHAVDLKEAALLDYYTAAIWWGREKAFTQDQLSAFYTVVHSLLDNMKEKNMGLVENVRFLKKLLAGIGQENTDLNGGLECFDVPQAKAITDYLYVSLFQHHKAFQFLFTHSQAEEIIGTDLIVDTAPPAGMPWPPPLDEGLDTEINEEYIIKPSLPKEEEEVDNEDDKADKEEIPFLTEEVVQDVLSKLNPEEVKKIMQEVFEDVIGGLQTEVAQKLRDKESTIITRINKVHKVAT